MHFVRFQKEFANIPGYTMPESMCVWDFLLEFQSQTWKPASMLEIGVFYGQSAMMLALHCKPKEIILLIDPTDYVEEARKRLSGFGVAKFEIIKARSSAVRVGHWLPGTHTPFAGFTLTETIKRRRYGMICRWPTIC